MNQERAQLRTWKLPESSVLAAQALMPADAGDVQANADAIQSALDEFGIEAKVVGASIGPKITQFKLRVDKASDLERISNLESNIALNLAAQSLRIEIKSYEDKTLFIDLPNRRAAIVPFSNLVSHESWRSVEGCLPILIGKDLEANTVIADLSSLRHVLFAGQTGSGKSNLNNVIITSLLLKHSPDDLKLILIDPKQVEMSLYEGIPHLQMPIITEPQQWNDALNWLSDEAKRRNDLFTDSGVGSLEEYRNVSESKLPYIVMISDELSDMMMADGRLVESTIRTLSAHGVSLGIHVIFSTSRPSVDVVTGLLKANMPMHWALATASRLDSQTLLDEPGAEKLLGQGDLLYRGEEGAQLRRVQVAHIKDDDVSLVAKFWANQVDGEDATVKAELKDGTRDQLEDDFEYFVFMQIGRFHKKGFFWKARLRWKLTKVWQSNLTNIGVPKMIKDRLGYEESKRLYEDIADNIMDDPLKLEEAIRAVRESNHIL